MAYASKGRHPYSDYMTSEGKVLHNLSGMDLIVDINGMYFPLRGIGGISKGVQVLPQAAQVRVASVIWLSISIKSSIFNCSIYPLHAYIKY